MKKINLTKVELLFNQEKSLDDTNLQRLKSILDNASFKIVVFGKYNHGKSTFLNAWLKKDLFKTGDIRTTTEIQSYKDDDNIIWVDTPGLDATVQDDDKANNAIKEADIILLVHDSVSGELDKKEFDFIKEPAKTYKGKIKLLLTKVDQNEEHISDILRLIENQIHDFNIKVFPISPIRYQKYITTQSAIWKEKSGFDALQDDIDVTLKTRDKIRKEEIKNLLDYLIQQLEARKIKTESDIDVLNQKIAKKRTKFNNDVENTLNHL